MQAWVYLLRLRGDNIGICVPHFFSSINAKQQSLHCNELQIRGYRFVYLKVSLLDYFLPLYSQRICKQKKLSK